MRESVVKEQADDSWDSDVEVYGRNPVVAIWFEVSFEFADIPPGIEIIGEIFSLFAGNDFGEVSQEQREGAFYTDDAHSHIVLVKYKHVAR